MNDEQIQEHEEETERLAQGCAKGKPKQMKVKCLMGLLKTGDNS